MMTVVGVGLALGMAEFDSSAAGALYAVICAVCLLRCFLAQPLSSSRSWQQTVLTIVAGPAAFAVLFFLLLAIKPLVDG